MSIKIGTKIEKLAPSDTYKLMDLADIAGAENISTDLSGLKAGQRVLQSNIDQKISGIHIEDVDNNAYDDITALHFTGATITDVQSGDANILIKPKITIADGQEPTSKSYDVNALIFDGQSISVDPNDANVGYVNIAAAQSGIGVSNNAADVAGVTHLEFTDAIITNKGSGTVQVEPTIHFHNFGDNANQYDTKAKGVVVINPLKAFSDPDTQDFARLEIDHAAFEPMHTPSFLAYLAETEEVVGKVGSSTRHHDGALWFDDVIVPNGIYIQADKNNKSYAIQEADQGDPNVTGGTNYLIAFRASLNGKAPNDGFVRIYLREKGYTGSNEGYILDVNGNPVVVERHYKAGEVLGTLDAMAIVNAKALKYFTCHVVDNFVDDMLNLTDRTEGGTGLMIQALTSNRKTGDGLQQFQLDTNQNIRFSSHYLGEYRASLGWAIQQNKPVTIGQPGQGVTQVDGFHFYNITRMKAGVENGHLLFQDDGTNLCDFNFGKVFSAEETQMLRGKDIDVTATLTDKDSGWEIALMKWVGKPDEYTDSIFKTRNNGTPVFDANWVKASGAMISEDAVSGDHTFKHTFIVPADANNYAVIIYPVEDQQPMTLKLKEFRVDVSQPFVGFALKAPETLGELHPVFDLEYKKLVQNTQGFASLRYTINNKPTPMPVGIPGKGLADISLDSTVNAIAGSQAKGGEGAIVFDNAGNASVSTQLFVHNEQGTDNLTHFWYSTVDQDSKALAKIPESDIDFTVPANSAGIIVTMPTFKLDVEAGDMIVLTASTSKPDGAFLQCNSDHQPMIDTAITFKELSTSVYP